MIQILSNHESTYMLRAHDTFPTQIQYREEGNPICSAGPDDALGLGALIQAKPSRC
jgi:hypothetical protein